MDYSVDMQIIEFDSFETAFPVQPGKESAVITTDPDNEASRRTCERIGCLEERTVKVPVSLQKEWELSGEKVRYIWKI